MTVDQYTDRFHELTVRSKVVENEQQTPAHYRTGLRNELRKETLIAQLLSIDETYQLALRVEKQLGFFNGRRMSSIDPRQERAPTQPYQKPPLPTDQGRHAMVGDQRGKAKLVKKFFFYSIFFLFCYHNPTSIYHNIFSILSYTDFAPIIKLTCEGKKSHFL